MMHMLNGEQVWPPLLVPPRRETWNPSGFASATARRPRLAARSGGQPEGRYDREDVQMVQVRGATSNRNLQVGLAGGNLQIKNPKSEILVPLRGLEPPTPSLRMTCSTN